MLKFVLLALLVANLSATLSYGAAADRITGPIDSANMVALARSVHPKAQPQYDQGAVEPSYKLSYITLSTSPSPAQQKALDKLLAQQQDPTSPNYHKWLTPAEYADRFGLSQHDIEQIIGWLKSQGFTILSVGGGRNTVIFSGTAEQVERAFRTEIHRYNVEGEQHFANATPIMIPAALNGVVTGIRGLHDFRPKPASRLRSFGPGRDRLSPEYYDAKWQFPNFLAPADVNTIYDIPSSLNGANETIAIMGQADIFEADIDDFRKGFGLSTSNLGCTLTGSTPGPAGIITACSANNFKYVLVGSDSSPTPGQDIGEADLDIEWSGAVAPSAQVIFVNAPNTASGVFDAISYAISPNGGPPLAPVISMSYGLCEAEESGNIESELSQANSEGVTILIASGDQGGAPCDRTPPNANQPFQPAVGGGGVDYPASSPYVTAVGGTSISYADDANPPTTESEQYWNTPNPNPANGGTAKKYIPELTWNDDEDIANYCVGEGANANPNICDPTFTAPAHGVAITSAETAQEDYWTSAGGGGMSNCAPGLTQNNVTCTIGFTQPAYQTTLALPSPPSGTQYRYVPDIALLASPNFPGYVFCTPQNPFPSSGSPTYTSTCDPGTAAGIFTAVDTYVSVIGGTSASTPVFAGMVTLLNQSVNGPSSAGLGNINTNLYKLAATPANGVFHQITGGSNIVYCKVGASSRGGTTVCPASGTVGFQASNADPTTGYNLVTGLGSVDVANLAASWSGTLGPSSTTVSPSLAQTYQSNSVTLTATVTPSTATGTVVFTYSNNSGPSTALGSSTLNSSGVASATTTQLPVGTNVITATYKGNGSLSSSSNTTTVTIVQAYTLSANASTYTVSPGGTATVNITVNTNGSGFTGNLTYTCTEQATLTESTCTPPSGPVPITQTASIMITTTAPSGALRRPFDRQQVFYAALFPGLVGIMFTFTSRRRRLGGVRILGLIMALGFSTLWLGSCGGSNSSQKNPGTTPGNYTITINSNSGSGQISGATSQIQVTLAVQQ